MIPDAEVAVLVLCMSNMLFRGLDVDSADGPQS